MPGWPLADRSIRLVGGPVTVTSRRSPDRVAGFGGDGARAFTDAASSRAEAGAAALPRASCRGVSSGFDRPSPALFFPGDFGNSGNAIGLELALHGSPG